MQRQVHRSDGGAHIVARSFALARSCVDMAVPRHDRAIAVTAASLTSVVFNTVRSIISDGDEEGDEAGQMEECYARARRAGTSDELACRLCIAEA